MVLQRQRERLAHQKMARPGVGKEGEDFSRDKLELDGKWALAAVPGFGYFMVFERDALAGDDSYTFDEFKSTALNG